MTSRLTLSLNELEAFVAVVEQGNFSRAASALGLSQPTVSQRVQTFEAQLGLRLLDRRHGARLTDNGREIYNRARALLAGAGEIEAIARELSGMARGRFKIGFSTPPFAMPVLARMRAAYPGIEIAAQHGNTANLIEAIAACEIDASLMTLIETPSGMRAERLAGQQPMLCVRFDSALARRRSLRLAAIREHTVILREQGSLTRRMFELACAREGVQPEQVLVMPSREAVKEAAAAGLGIGVVLSGEIGCDSRLVALNIVNSKPMGGIYAVSLSETAGLPLVEAFFRTCREVSLEQPAEQLAAR